MRRKDLEIRDIHEIEEILQTADTCRVAMHAGTYPYIVPFNYGYESKDGTFVLYFHSARQGRKLDLLGENPMVGFEIDCDHEFRHLDRGMYCTMDYRSIMGTGEITVLEDREEIEKAIRLLLAHYGSPDGFEITDAHVKATAMLKLTVHSYTGKKKTP